MVLGIPMGLTVGGLLSDRFGDAATFEICGVGVLLALAAAWALPGSHIAGPPEDDVGCQLPAQDPPGPHDPGRGG